MLSVRLSVFLFPNGDTSPKYPSKTLTHCREHRAEPRGAGRPGAAGSQAAAHESRGAPLEPDGGAECALQGQLDGPRRQGDDQVERSSSICFTSALKISMKMFPSSEKSPPEIFG